MAKYSTLFIKNVRIALQKAGLTQLEAAKRAGMEQAQLARYLTGKNVPGLDAAGQIADALGLRLSELLATEDPAPRMQEHDLHECLNRVSHAALRGIDKPAAEPVPLRPEPRLDNLAPEIIEGLALIPKDQTLAIQTVLVPAIEALNGTASKRRAEAAAAKAERERKKSS